MDEVNKETFDNKVITKSAELPVMVFVHGPYCGQCKMMEPIVERIHKGSNNKVYVVGMDTETCMEIAKKYEVKKLPTFLFFHAGELKDTIVGPTTQSLLVNKLKEYIN